MAWVAWEEWAAGWVADAAEAPRPSTRAGRRPQARGGVRGGRHPQAGSVQTTGELCSERPPGRALAPVRLGLRTSARAS